MVKILNFIVEAFNSIMLYIRCKRAIKKADRKAIITGKKYLVMMYNKKPIVLSKQRVKKLIREGAFVKGTTPERLEKIAIYKTR